MKPLVLVTLLLGIVRVGNAHSSLEAQYLEEASHAMDQMMGGHHVAQNPDGA
jgi:hypothetical protein